MSKRTLVPIGVASAAVAAVGYFFLASSQPEPDYASVRALVQALETGGVECARLTVSSPEQAEQVGGEFGFCFIGKERPVNVHVYEEAADVQEHVRNNVAARHANNPNYFKYLVTGPHWVVDTYKRAEAERVQGVLGGTIY